MRRVSLVPMIALAACAVSLCAADADKTPEKPAPEKPAVEKPAVEKPAAEKPAAPRGSSLAKRFEAADANKDGKLSRAEFRVLRAADKETTRERITARGETFDDERFDIRTEEIFMKLDTDNDGFVSKEEFAKYSAANSQQPPVKEAPAKKEAAKKEPPKKEPPKKAPPPKKPAPKKK
ncbi:MAG: EF-hand domain-containing protein [Kiritimatiellaeota bacterium]|nr:EF-hand domain-containing protein [Kiritimatiellota bacterium]